MAKFKVIVLGCGLAGGLLANGLSNNDIDVEVYERLARDATREGYQIRLGASALIGLRACLTKDHLTQVIGKFGHGGGNLAKSVIIYDKNFKPVLDTNLMPVYSKTAPISRKALRDILAQPLDQAGKLYYSKNFERYEILEPGTDNEKVRVWFSDGTSSDSDVIIAADGSHSKVNEQIGLKNLKSVHSHYMFLTKTGLPSEKFLHMPQEFLRTATGVQSDNRSLYFCAYLPPDVASMATSGAKKWKLDDSISWCFFAYAVPKDDVPENMNEMSLEEKWRFLREDLRSRWCSRYDDILDLLDGNDVYALQSRYSTKPDKNWRAKVKSKSAPELGHPRVMLIGDAIHAMLPNRAMGANTAMRDASVLLPLLKNLAAESKLQESGVSNDAVKLACQQYEAEMLPRAFEWVAKSGGGSIIMMDTATWKGQLFVTIANIVLSFASVFVRLSGFFFNKKFVDDTPEFD